MSRAIIETAVANNALHLELEYREFSPAGYELLASEAHVGAELTERLSDPQFRHEFACLLTAILRAAEPGI